MEKNAVLDAMYAISPNPIMAWNENLEIVFSNTAVQNLYAVKNHDVLVACFESFFLDSGKTTLSYSSFTDELEKVKKTGSDVLIYEQVNAKGKRFLCRMTVKTIELPDNTEMLAGFIETLEKYLYGKTEDLKLEHNFSDALSLHTFTKSVLNLVQEAFFYLDLRSNHITFYGSNLADGIEHDVTLKFPDFFIENKLIYTEDIDLFVDMIQRAQKGENLSFDLRLNTAKGLQKYYRIRYNLLWNDNKKVIAIIGTAGDIDEEKALELRSKTDLLTDCYNKITAESMIEEYIKKTKNADGVLFIIDIDNFKAINDNLGHHFGDVVLKELSTKLKACFRFDDIIGRIGGDEFIVLAKDLRDQTVIEQKAEKVIKVFQNKYQGDIAEYKVSGSVGIARCPFDGKDFESLYKAADKALYQSKLKGKDCYTFYTKDLVDGTMRNRTILENAGRVANAFFDNDLITEVFELLYETQDIHLSINMALKCIGKRYNADRSYIFEAFDNGTYYDNTYEWCKEGIPSEIDSLKNVTRETLNDFFTAADSEGVIYSNDLTVLKAEGAFELMARQGIKSFIHAQTREKDVVKVFLGLDDCTNPRVWTPKELNSLKYIVKLMSVFLTYERKA